MVQQQHREQTPWFGSRHDTLAALRDCAIALCVAFVYTFVAAHFFGTPTSALELWGLVPSLACVWLVRTENVWNMPLGIIASLLLAIYFFRIDLVGQAWLQLGFFVPVQFAGWWMWCRGGAGRTRLDMTRAPGRTLAFAAAGGLAAWFALWAGFKALYGQTPFQGWDASIVAASVVAQLLLNKKRAEHWLVWLVPVNLSAIALYAASGAWAFAFLYVIYLVNAAWGWVVWRNTLNADRKLPAEHTEVAAA